MSYTIDETGIDTPSESEIRDIVVSYWMEAHGTGAQTASETPDGLIIDIIATQLHLSWEAAVILYNDTFFGTAGYDQLVLILEPLGMAPLSASPSTVTLILTGTDTTVIPAGSIVRAGTEGGNFETDAEATLSTGGTARVILVHSQTTNAGGTTLEIDVGGGTVTSYYNDTDGDGTNTEDLAQEHAGNLNADSDFSDYAYAYVAGTDEDGAARLIVIMTVAFAVTHTVSGSTSWATMEAAQAIVTATCTITGPITGAIGEVDTIVTPITGWDGASNYIAAIEGRNDETASELRARWLARLAAGGAATAKQLRARLLDLTDAAGVSIGILTVTINENETDTVNVLGLPPHSFEVIVWQRSSTPAHDTLIQECIYTFKPMGIQAYGDTTDTIAGDLGDRDIGFTRVDEYDLHVAVTVTKGEGFPESGDEADALEAAILDYFSEGGDGELVSGSDFNHASVNVPVILLYPGKVSGVAVTSDSVLAGLPAGALDASDETADEYEILIPALSNIAVTLA